MDSPTYQGIELAEFVGYMGKRVIEDSYISTRNLINKLKKEGVPSNKIIEIIIDTFKEN